MMWMDFSPGFYLKGQTHVKKFFVSDTAKDRLDTDHAELLMNSRATRERHGARPSVCAPMLPTRTQRRLLIGNVTPIPFFWWFTFLSYAATNSATKADRDSLTMPGCHRRCCRGTREIGSRVPTEVTFASRRSSAERASDEAAVKEWTLGPQ